MGISQELLNDALMGGPARDWRTIGEAPRDGREIEVRGEGGPYGVTSWTGRAKWGLPINWHRDSATWLSPEGAVLWLAGYKPTEWRSTTE